MSMHLWSNVMKSVRVRISGLVTNLHAFASLTSTIFLRVHAVGKGNRCNYRILILIAVWFIGCMQRVTNILFSLINTNNIEGLGEIKIDTVIK